MFGGVRRRDKDFEGIVWTVWKEEKGVDVLGECRSVIIMGLSASFQP